MESSDVELLLLRSKRKLRKRLTFLERKFNSNPTETTFIWHVENFEMCPDQWGKPLKSPEFSIYNWQSPTFYLSLYPGGVNEKSSKYLSVYLVKSSGEEDNFTCSYKLGFITTEDNKLCSEFCNKNFNRGEGKGSAEFFEREKLLGTEKDVFLPDGHLTIFCEINVVKFNDLDVSVTSSLLKDLSDVYAIIYDTGKFCDLYLHVGEKTFKVHKAILEARFPDLLKNAGGNKCKIQTISPKTMDALLRYIYTGFLNINELNLFEIISSNYILPSHLKYLLLEKLTKVEFTTCFKKTVIAFSCNVRNLSSLDPSEVIHYSLVGDYKIKWTWLDLYLFVTTDETNESYLSISIERFSNDCKKIICTIKTSDLSKTFEHTYVKDDKWTLPNYFTKALLKETTSDDEINLDFEIAVSDGSKKSELKKKELILNSGLTHQISQDLKSLQKDLTNIANVPNFCDITLISGKEKIRCHKFILTARSPVFCEMLETDAKMKNSEITIDDQDCNVIKDMLRYVYCNEVKFSLPGHTHIYNMYNAAGKYNLPGLKEKCMHFLKSNLSAETAGDILISADKWNDDELKELVYNFVCTNPLQTANSTAWGEVMSKRSDLASEVLKKTLTYLAAKNKIINIETD